MSDYQGWKNHPTWLVWVWLENDFSMYSHCQQLKAESQDVREIAEDLKSLIEDCKPQLSDLWNDLIDSALAEVDWRELATNLLEE
jgi:hypothetical protein